MRSFLLLCIYMLIGCAVLAGNGIVVDGPTPKSKKKNRRYKIPSYASDIIEDRLEALGYDFDLRYNKQVRRFINSYVVRGRKGTEVILGRTATYLPIFQQYLADHNLPQELQYLAIVESALDNRAESPVGACGLWQFMPATGRLYGLDINDYVDERFDVHLASNAAARYLADLYKRYDDWALVLAAYNCGPGRLNKAIEKGKSRDFWKIRGSNSGFSGIFGLAVHEPRAQLRIEERRLEIYRSLLRNELLPFSRPASRISGL